MKVYHWLTWGTGANSIGHYSKWDRVRCTDCRQWAKTPAWYELDRVLCQKCHTARGERARSWLEAD